MGPELIEVARLHLDLGRSLLPVAANKRPHDAALKATGHTSVSADGQVKASWKPLQNVRADLKTIEEWLRFPGCGLALIGGAISGMVIIDADLGNGTDKFHAWGLSGRAHVQSPGGGLHWYLRHPGWKVRTAQSHTGEALALIRGVDIRADGGYVVIPPSSFPKGRYRSLRNPSVLDSADLLPEDVRALLNLDAPPPEIQPMRPRNTSDVSPTGRESARTHGLPGTDAEFELPAPGTRWTGKDGQTLENELVYRALNTAHAGASREETGFALAKQLRDNGLSKSETQGVMTRYQEQTPDISAKGIRDPYTLQQAMGSVEQAYSRAARQPWGVRRVRSGPPVPETVSTALARTWPQLNTDERQKAGRCACHLKGEEQRRALDFLAVQGVNVPELQNAERERGLQGFAAPGTATLWRLLKAAQSRGNVHRLEHAKDD